MSKPMRIVVIPDVQVRPEDDVSFLRAVGEYTLSRQPDVIVQIGDFCDFASIEQHSKSGSRIREGRRYFDDVHASRDAMDAMLEPLRKYQKKHSEYKPRLILTLGNHENRVTRYIEDSPVHEHTMSLADLGLEKAGWKVYPFLQPVVVAGVAFCHYFVSGVMGKPVTSARALITKHHMSCFAGHQQGRDIAYGRSGDGRQITAIISGSCYEHDEGYLNPQTNGHWRGLYVLNNVSGGSFDEMPVPLHYIKKEYL